MSQIIRRQCLAADSPKKAFYELFLIMAGDEGGFLIKKQSGAQRKVLDTHVWNKASLDDANAFFERKLKEKTNPARKSPRKYRPVTEDEWETSIGPGR